MASNTPPRQGSMTIRKPESALDLPCPRTGCLAIAGEMCWKDPLSSTTPRRHTGKVHDMRESRLEQAQRDWTRLQEWNALVRG